MIRLKVNGKEYTLKRSLTVSQFIERLGIPAKGIIVEYNYNFLERELHKETMINDGDTLEIIHAFAGG